MALTPEGLSVKIMSVYQPLATVQWEDGYIGECSAAHLHPEDDDERVMLGMEDDAPCLTPS